MRYTKGQPTVRNRASVITTSLTIKVLEQHQLDAIFPYLVEHNHSFSFECDGVGDSLTPETYTLEIFDISWANNVTALFKKLEEYDFNTGEDEE